MTYQQAIQQACERVGSQAGLAKAIEVAPAIVHQWRSGARPVPVQHCLAIERATEGAVTRRDLRPTDWHLIWPELDGEHWQGVVGKLCKEAISEAQDATQSVAEEEA